MGLRTMRGEWMCPVCGGAIETRIYRSSLFGKVSLPPNNNMTVLAYRCENGHICLASDKSEDEDIRVKLAA